MKFAEDLMQIGRGVGMKISSRGWAYQLEGFREINKDQFDSVEGYINDCRERGYLPIDFTAEEESRGFSGVEIPDTDTPGEFINSYLFTALVAERYYTPDWWEDEEYYIQMVVEKIDIKTLFEPVCHKYHIPIATAKGWSSMLQRATYARRFQEAQEKRLIPVLLYCGDHDPDGLRISEFLRSNLDDLKGIRWIDGTTGYDPVTLIIERFGLNFDFIEANNLTWIDNLITGSGKNLADPAHKNHHQSYVQEYITKYGVRKCEANALIVNRDAAETLCRGAIEKYLGVDAIERFKKKREETNAKFAEYREKTGIAAVVRKAMSGEGAP